MIQKMHNMDSRETGPDISVVILTKNGGNRLIRVIEAVQHQQIKGNPEILCLDSGSSERELNLIRNTGVSLHVLKKVPFNHGLTRDFGISISKGEIVVLLTQDALPLGIDWLSSLVAPLYTDEKVAASYGRQVPGPDASTGARARLEAWYASEREGKIQQMPPRDVFYGLDATRRLEIVAFDHVSCALRRSVWELFHHGPSSFGEDIAWAFRVMSAGYSIAYTPESVVEHSHDLKLRELVKRIVKDHRNLTEVLGTGFISTPGEAFVSSVRGAVAALTARWSDAAEAPPPGRLRIALETWFSAWAMYIGFLAAKKNEHGVSVHEINRKRFFYTISPDTDGNSR